MDWTTPKQGPVDIWTGPHFVAGFIMGAYGLKASTAFAASAAFELGENALAEVLPLRKAIPGAGSESAVNAVADVGFNMLGWSIARMMRRRRRSR